MGSTPNMSATAFGTWQLCPRKWWYQYVAGMRTPKTAALERGTAVHAAIEAYLIDGAWPTDADPGIVAIAAQGQPALDDLRAWPGESHVEAHLRLPPGSWMGPLPFRGMVDWWGAAGVPTILDHKTTRDLTASYHPTPATIVRNPQMALYAGVLFHDDPPPAVNLGHLRYSTEGAGFARVMGREATPWSAVEDVLGEAGRLSGEMAGKLFIGDPKEVDYNRSGCGAYGGCPHIAYCPVHTRPFAGIGGTMGLLDRIKQQGKAEAGDVKQAAPAAVTPPDTSGTATVTNKQISDAASDMLVALGFDVALADIVAHAVTEEGRALLARHGLTSAALPAILQEIDGDDAPADDAPGDDAPANPVVANPVVAYLSKNGRVPSDDPSLRDLVREAVGAKRLSAKAFVAYLGKLADDGMLEFSAAEVWPVSRGIAAAQEVAAVRVAPPAVDAEQVAAPAPTPARAPVVTSCFYVFVACIPENSPAIHIDDLLAPVYGKVEKAAGVPHYALVDYGKGPALVYGAAGGLDLDIDVIVPDRHPMLPFVGRLFPDHTVVRGVL